MTGRQEEQTTRRNTADDEGRRRDEDMGRRVNVVPLSRLRGGGMTGRQVEKTVRRNTTDDEGRQQSEDMGRRVDVVPLSRLRDGGMTGRQEEQTVRRNTTDDEGRRRSEDKGQRVNAVPLSRLRDGGMTSGSKLPRGHPVSGPHPPQLSTTSVNGGGKDVTENTNIVTATLVLATNTITSVLATNSMTSTFIAAAEDRITTTLPATVIPSIHTLSSSSSSSCSSITCQWVTSWYFLGVACITVAWLLVLAILCCLTKTTKGRRILAKWSSTCESSLCTEDNIKEDEEEEQEKVRAESIGYFEGSPGMRRVVLFGEEEDDKEEEEEEEEVKDINSLKTSDNETEGSGSGERSIFKTMKPPRKGTYILQDATKTDLLEVGTYRLSEDEEQKVDGEEEVEDTNEVAYVLEGGTYILQTERIARGGIDGIEEYGETEIEGLYDILQEELQCTRSRRTEGLHGLSGVKGKGGKLGKYKGTRATEGLNEVIKRGESIERENKELQLRYIEQDIQRKFRREIKGDEKEIYGGMEKREFVKRKKLERKVFHKSQSIGDILDTLEGREDLERDREKPGGAEEERIQRSLNPRILRRINSFPMDGFLSSQFKSRPLSRIVEEDIP